jgi:hypothetical protein
LVGNRAGIILFRSRTTLPNCAAVRETLIINLWLIVKSFAEHRIFRARSSNRLIVDKEYGDARERRSLRCASRLTRFLKLRMRSWRFKSSIAKLLGACNRRRSKMSNTLVTALSVSTLAALSLVAMPSSAQSQVVIIVGNGSGQPYLPPPFPVPLPYPQPFVHTQVLSGGGGYPGWGYPASGYGYSGYYGGGFGYSSGYYDGGGYYPPY